MKEKAIKKIKAYVQNLWSTGNNVEINNKMYRVGKMSYGNYFLEPVTWKGGEKDGFDNNTIWLVFEEDFIDLLKLLKWESITV